MASMNERTSPRKTVRTQRAQVIEFPTKVTHIQVLQVELRIVRDWLRGLTIRKLAKHNDVPCSEIEKILREHHPSRRLAA